MKTPDSKISDLKITDPKILVLKFLNLQFWQYLALLSGSIIAVVMALASVSYNSTLGTSEPAFGWVPVTNKTLFEVLALAFDLGMIASVFGFWHWLSRNRVAAAICVYAVCDLQCFFRAFRAWLYRAQCHKIPCTLEAQQGCLCLPEAGPRTGAKPSGLATGHPSSRREAGRAQDCCVK